MYKDIPYKEKPKGIKHWVNPKNRFNVIALHYSADPKKDPDKNDEWFKNEKRGAPKAVWNKEYEMDDTTKSGRLIYSSDFCDFDKKIHFINSYELPEPYELLISLDFGQRNPTCALIGAYDQKGVLYIIDEYYKAGIPSVSSKKMFNHFGYLMGDMEDKSITQKRNMAISTFSIRVIDPKTRDKNRTKKNMGEEIEYSVIEEFWDNGWDFEPGHNAVDAGITRVREYLQLDEDQKAHLYIFKDKCPYLTWELENYRYKQQTEVMEKTRNKSEEPMKKDDHAVDALRYMIMTRPATPIIKEKPLTRIQKDIQSLTKPKVWVNDWDDDSGNF